MKITRTETNIIVHSEYNSEFVTHARNLAGRWDDTQKSWIFDIRNEADVLQACYLAYGEDGVRNNKCSVKITLPNGYYVDQGTICFFGRQIARAFGRDSGAKVFPGVVIKEGGFSSGGSAKHWTTRALKGTVLILRDVSRPMVEMAIKEGIEDVEIEILPAQVNPDVLHRERDALLARLAEINAQLGE